MADEFTDSPNVQRVHRDTSRQAVTVSLRNIICIMGPAWLVECQINENGDPVISFSRNDRHHVSKRESVVLVSPRNWKHEDPPGAWRHRREGDLPTVPSAPAVGDNRNSNVHPRMKDLWARVLAERRAGRELALSPGSSTDSELSPLSNDHELVGMPLGFAVGRRAEVEAAAVDDHTYPAPPPPPSPIPAVVPASWPRPVPMRLRMPQPVRPRDIPRTRVLEELAQALAL